MKFLSVLLLLISCSCAKQKTAITNVVLENNEINTTYLNQIKAPEKALLSWYLYAYGNECDNSSTKIKCQLLKGLNVEDECSSQHLNDLLQWFSNDMLAVYKLNKCPSLPIKSAIQNTFEHIVLIRNIDTLSIKFSIKGLNTLQEKSWNTSRTERYLIKNSTLIKLSLNE